jgi:hypothetical protein
MTEPDHDSFDVRARRDDPSTWRQATVEEVASSLAYSLGWNKQGRPHGKRMGEMREMLAAWQVEHLLMSNYVIMKRPPALPHSTGGAPHPNDDEQKARQDGGLTGRS